MDAALVPARAPAVDRRRMVVEPPRAERPRIPSQAWRTTMKIAQSTFATAIAGISFAALLAYAGAAESIKVNFSDDTVGGDPKSFVSVVGVWRVEAEGNKKVLAVDGRQWKEGQTAAGVADKARALRRALRRVPRPRSGLRLFPLRRVQGRDGFPRRRDLGAVRRHF